MSPPSPSRAGRYIATDKRAGKAVCWSEFTFVFVPIVSLCGGVADVKASASQLPLFEDDNKTVCEYERDKQGSRMGGLINNELEFIFFNLADLGGLPHKAGVILGL